MTAVQKLSCRSSATFQAKQGNGDEQPVFIQAYNIKVLSLSSLQPPCLLGNDISDTLLMIIQHSVFWIKIVYNLQDKAI